MTYTQIFIRSNMEKVIVIPILTGNVYYAYSGRKYFFYTVCDTPPPPYHTHL